MRSLKPFLCAVSLVLLIPAARAQDDTDPYLEDVAQATTSLRQGKLRKARSVFEEILDAFEEESGEDRPGAAAMRATRTGLMHLDLIQGEYAAVLRTFPALPPVEQKRAENLLIVGRARFRTGAYEAAIQDFRSLVDAGRGGFEARYRLSRAVAAASTAEAARDVLRAAVKAGEASRPTDPIDQAYLARCYMELGGRANMEAASGLLVESIRAAPDRAEARIAYAELFFLAYRESRGYPTAEKQLKPVFENNGDVEEALLVMYRSRSFNMFLEPAKTAAFLDRALQRNKNSVPALVLRASRLIDDRLFEAGEQVLDSALAINPRHREALAHRSVVAHLRHQDAAAADFRKRAMAGRTVNPEIDRIYGDHLAALYRFADSEPYFRKALAADPNYVPAMHGLAKSLVYLGKGDEAVKLLTKAKELEAGFADAWRKNILLSEKRLSQEYEVIESDHFLVLMHKEDRAVLEPYLLQWYEDAYRLLGRKYGYQPSNKVRVEVLHEWVDFSVRTIGFRGFSALGACFGEFLTMVSPSDPQLRLNDFMWSATAWHEYTHVLTLALSNARVPRWLTEGMSVYEESAKNKAWERGMLRELLDAHHNNELPPLRLLNRLFRGSRILFGYYQGGLVVKYLAETHGFGKVVSMLKAYGRDLGTEQIMQETFGMSSREFDRGFRTWVEKKLANLKLVPRLTERTVRRLRNKVQIQPDDLSSQLQLAWHFLRLTDRRGRRVGLVEAGIHLGEVLRRQPRHPMGLLCHAELLMNRKQEEAAVKAFQAGFAGGADDFESRLNFGTLLVKAGRSEQALSQFQSAKACWPNCTDQALAPELRIAKLLQERGLRAEAMMEMKSFCRRTARAFQPRMQLAEFERELGHHQAAITYLEECIQIDPFMRSLHVALADSYLQVGRRPLALRELKVALAVPTALDRAYALKRDKPSADSAEEKLARGKLCIRIARVCRSLKDTPQALEYLDRAVREAPDTEVVDDANELRAEWQK